MEFVDAIVFNLVPLFIIGAVIYLIVQRRRAGPTLDVPDPGIGTIRRTYFYAISFVALMMAANGIVLVIQFVLEGPVQQRRSIAVQHRPGCRGRTDDCRRATVGASLVGDTTPRERAAG